jgi:hypothetical protein
VVKSHLQLPSQRIHPLISNEKLIKSREKGTSMWKLERIKEMRYQTNEFGSENALLINTAIFHIVEKKIDSSELIRTSSSDCAWYLD